MSRMRNVTIENARLIFKNFNGNEDRFNPKGKRNFCVLLNHEDAEILAQDGWSIKHLSPKDENDEPTPYIKIAVSYKLKPPKIVVISSKGRNELDETTIGLIDWAEIAVADLIITPSGWDVNGKTGVTAYLKSLYITVVEDELEKKYNNYGSASQDPDDEC